MTHEHTSSVIPVGVAGDIVCRVLVVASPHHTSVPCKIADDFLDPLFVSLSRFRHSSRTQCWPVSSEIHETSTKHFGRSRPGNSASIGIFHLILVQQNLDMTGVCFVFPCRRRHSGAHVQSSRLLDATSLQPCSAVYFNRRASPKCSFALLIPFLITDDVEVVSMNEHVDLEFIVHPDKGARLETSVIMRICHW